MNEIANSPLPSHWRTLICNKESLSLVWKKLNEFPILFDDSVRGDYNYYLSEMLDVRSIILLTGDYGVCRFSDIIKKRECEVHLCFWDRRFKGRLEECQEVLRWLFSTLQLHRASISLPSIANSTISFVKALGFKREGIIRDAWSYNGRLLDLHLFGILEEEVWSKEEVKDDGEQAEIKDDLSNRVAIRDSSSEESSNRLLE
jgi:hypothetical protein